MKKIISIALIVCILFACNKESIIEGIAPVEDYTGPTGSAAFWLNINDGGPVTVKCAGQSKTISVYLTSPPDCGNPSAANFTLPVGTHTFTASSSKYNWSGEITIIENGCAKMRLY